MFFVFNCLLLESLMFKKILEKHRRVSWIFSVTKSSGGGFHAVVKRQEEEAEDMIAYFSVI